jgi:hypothetical protein
MVASLVARQTGFACRSSLNRRSRNSLVYLNSFIPLRTAIDVPRRVIEGETCFLLTRIQYPSGIYRLFSGQSRPPILFGKFFHLFDSFIAQGRRKMRGWLSIGRGSSKYVGDSRFFFANANLPTDQILGNDRGFLGEPGCCCDACGRNEFGDMAKCPDIPRGLTPIAQPDIAAGKSISDLEG